MFSIKHNRITLTRGDTLIAAISMTKDGESYTPVDGDVVRFAMKEKYSDAEVLITKTIPNDTLVLRLEPADTKPLAFGSYVYDIQITFADGTVDTFITGTLTLTEEVD